MNPDSLFVRARDTMGPGLAITRLVSERAASQVDGAASPVGFSVTGGLVTTITRLIISRL